MMFILSVFAVFVVKASLEGGSRAEARELAAFYPRGREASTIGVYGGEYRRLAEYCKDRRGYGGVQEGAVEKHHHASWRVAFQRRGLLHKSQGRWSSDGRCCVVRAAGVVRAGEEV